jgi:hypothetical protein
MHWKEAVEPLAYDGATDAAPADPRVPSEIWLAEFNDMPAAHDEPEYLTRRKRIDPLLKAEGWTIAPPSTRPGLSIAARSTRARLASSRWPRRSKNERPRTQPWFRLKRVSPRARRGLQQAEAGLAVARSSQQQSEAAERQATFALQAATSNVPAVQAQLDDARFNLAQCQMTAPADGYVVNWVVQEGTMLVPMPFAAAGTFICTSETFVVASFPQNYLVNVEPGNEVEVVLDPYPGRPRRRMTWPSA